MSDFKKYIPFIVLGAEKLIDQPMSKGGPVKFGINIDDWQRYGYDKNKDGLNNIEDLAIITKEDAYSLYKKKYWDAILADKIKNQSIANTLCDWYKDNPSAMTLCTKELLQLPYEDVVDEILIAALNKQNPFQLFTAIQKARTTYENNIVAFNPHLKDQLKSKIDNIIRFKFSEPIPKKKPANK
jgi:lysozyme family protein